MSYVESFDAVMEQARLDCNTLFLDKLQAAHDAEMKQLSKEEFYRGYESGVAVRDAEQWQLDRERAKIIEAVRKVVPEGYFGSDEMLSEICRAIYSPVFGWTAEAGRYLCDRLIYLLGGESINKGAETNAKVMQNGEGGHEMSETSEEEVDCLQRLHEEAVAKLGQKPICNKSREEAFNALRDVLKQYSKQDPNTCRWLVVMGMLDAYHDAVERDIVRAEGKHSRKEAVHRTVAERLSKLKLTGGRYENLSAICSCIYPDAFGWTRGDCLALCDQLLWLFGRGHETGETTPYDELGNERHKAVCRLRGFEPCIGGKPTEEASKLIRCIIGREDCHVACGNDLEEARDRLIYLLGGKTTNRDAETSAKVIKNGEKYQLATYDVLGNERHKAVCELRNARDGMNDSMAYNVSRIMYAIGAEPKVGERVCKTIADRLIHLLGDECNFSSDESDTDIQDDGTNPAETSEWQGNHVSLDTPSSITDELRKWASEGVWSRKWDESDVIADRIARKWDEFYAIAGRIDEQFSRICSQQESVLQQTISDAVDEHEREMAELRQKISARDMIIDNYHERMKGLDEAERRMAVAESKCKELQSRYDRLLATYEDLTSLANKYFNEVNELFSDETN